MERRRVRNAAPSPEPKISQVDGLLEDREGRLKHSDGATVTPGVASLQANEASVASQSLDLDLLWWNPEGITQKEKRATCLIMILTMVILELS
eukprot:g11150.t1